MFMITYSTNFMGPISSNWYDKNNIPYEIIIKPNRFSSDGVLTTKRYLEHYAGGRLDIRGTGSYFGEEIGLPIMKFSSWTKLQDYCNTLKTRKVLSLEEILYSMWLQTGHSIEWF